jgi:hypothetical protein
MFPHQTMNLTKWMAMDVYGHDGPIPHAEPHTRLPPWLDEPSPPSWNITTQRQAWTVSLQPPDPARHRFWSEPSYLVLDVDIDNLWKDTSIPAEQWYGAVKTLFPQFYYKSDYQTIKDSDYQVVPTEYKSQLSNTRHLVCVCLVHLLIDHSR